MNCAKCVLVGHELVKLTRCATNTRGLLFGSLASTIFINRNLHAISIRHHAPHAHTHTHSRSIACCLVALSISLLMHSSGFCAFVELQNAHIKREKHKQQTTRSAVLILFLSEMYKNKNETSK